MDNKSYALITGASGGIGSAVAKRLSQMGYNIFAGYHTNEQAVKKLALQLETVVIPIRLDLSDGESITRVVAQCVPVPEIIVNCGGCESIGLFQDLSDEELYRVINVNLVGAMLLTKRFLPEMIRRHHGYIVNVSSVWGEVGASCEVAYSAAKAGLIGFTKALASELAPSGILVNCVSPGFIDTQMNGQLSVEEKQALIEEIPCGRAGTSKDAAEAIAFLVSGKADYICGQTIRIDGKWR